VDGLQPWWLDIRAKWGKLKSRLTMLATEKVVPASPPAGAQRVGADSKLSHRAD
jgi:hypothetical protein